MSKGNHHSELLTRYLSGRMTADEAHSFEKLALADPFLQDALEGAESISVDDFKKDIENINKKLKPQTSQKWLWKIAASISLVAISGFAVWILTDNLTNSQEQIASAQHEEELLVAPLDSVTSTEQAELSVEPIVQEQSLKKEDRSTTSIKIEKPKRAASIVRVEPKESEIPVEEQLDLDSEVALADEPESDAFFDQEDLEEEQVDFEKSAPVTRAHSKSFFQTRAAVSELQSEPVQIPRTITGQVLNDFEESIGGVNVFIKGTAIGTITDEQGRYEIQEVTDTTVLRFSWVGMETQEVVVGPRNEVDVKLLELAQSQDVVVSGFGAYDNEPNGFEEPTPLPHYRAFKEYLEENLFYPEEAISNQTEGRVTLQLTISPIGEITNIEVKKSLGDGCDEEAVRLIREGPKWSPATRDGLNVETKVRVRIKFELD